MGIMEKTFKEGAVRATVWYNGDITSGYRTISLTKSYKKGNEWKSTSSLNHRDLGDALTVLSMAYEYLASEKSSISISKKTETESVFEDSRINSKVAATSTEILSFINALKMNMMDLKRCSDDEDYDMSMHCIKDNLKNFITRMSAVMEK
jgi:hypothetical protein